MPEDGMKLSWIAEYLGMRKTQATYTMKKLESEDKKSTRCMLDSFRALQLFCFVLCHKLR